MKISTFLGLTTGMLTALNATGGPRASASYSITTDIADIGGGLSTSASYTTDGSIGGVVGISTAASPAETAKHGYIGQLFDVVGFTVSASPSTVDEGGTQQLNGFQLLDDDSYLALNPAQVSWSVLSGPIASISAGGLARAGIVYQDTAATVQGIYNGDPSQLDLTVRNVNDDDYDTYAGDGVTDDWQVQHFGPPPNADAGPLADPDGDGQNNRFEWVAGVDPMDAASVFKFKIERSSQGALLIFSPIVSGRTYTLTYSHDLSLPSPWTAASPELPVTTIGTERTVIDTGASAVPKRFYRVEIAR